MHTYDLNRRGYDLGVITKDDLSTLSPRQSDIDKWHTGRPVFLENFHFNAINKHTENLKRSKKLYEAVFKQQEYDSIFSSEPYLSRLRGQFESLGSSFNQGHDQEIETLFFDAIKEEKLVAEDLWLKISWLSFYENDASVRFRFSFGVDFEEDVALDPERQRYAANLAYAIFPESDIITTNKKLAAMLANFLGVQRVSYVEQIIYFNAANGGAYLHHDRERGHAGVVYAQLTGVTYWLALPKRILISEISDFITECNNSSCWPENINEAMQAELFELQNQAQGISRQLESFANSTLIHLINETKEFTQRLIQHGHGQLVKAGDFLLLPQENDEHCCWHSVLNIGDEPGEALSFAIRGD